MKLISIEKMASELGSTKEGVYARMRRGQLPEPLRIGDTPFWREEDWRNWLDKLARQQGVAVTGGAENIQAAPAVKRRGRPRNGKEVIN